MDKVKIVKEKKDLYIEFSEEEIKELGWKDNQRLSMDLQKDNSIIIKPWVTMELDTSTWPKEIFEFLVQQSIDTDKSVNDVIVDIITKSLNIDEKNAQLICENGNV